MVVSWRLDGKYPKEMQKGRGPKKQNNQQQGFAGGHPLAVE